MKGFNNFVFETVYSEWNYFILKGYPVSFEVYESIVTDRDYNLKLLNLYHDLKIKYGNGFNNELHTEIRRRIVRHLIEIQTTDFDFSLFGGIDVSNHSKTDFEPSTYEQISNYFAYRLDYYFYNHADFNILPTENLNKLLQDGIIFIFHNRLKSLSNSYGEFIESQLIIFRQLLIKNNLDYFDIVNTFQEDILTAIQKEDMTKDDIIILKKFDYDLENLNNENDYLNYLEVAFKITSTFSAKKLRQIVLSNLKTAVNTRLEENKNEPGSPPLDWLNLNWHSIGLGKGLMKITSKENMMAPVDSNVFKPTLETISKELVKQVVLEPIEKYKFLNESLEINGFRDIPLVIELSDDKYNKLLSELNSNSYSYGVAMLHHLGFIDYLMSKMNTRKRDNAIAKIFSKKDDRYARSLINRLRAMNKENEHILKSEYLLDDVIEFYESLK